MNAAHLSLNVERFMDLRLTLDLSDAAAELPDGHAPHLHPDGRAGLAADRIPHRERQRSSQGERGGTDPGARARRRLEPGPVKGEQVH